MSVAQGSAAYDDAVAADAPEAAPAAEAWTPLEVPADPPAAPAPRRLVLPPLPPVRSGPTAWARALRVGSLPLPLLGAAVGGLTVARDATARPGLLALAVGGLVLAHGLGALLHDLGDARPGRAGPLRRIEAVRGALVLAGLGAVGLLALVVVHGPLGLALAGTGALGGLLVLSRRAGAGTGATAGLLLGAASTGAAAWAATGALDRRALLCALVVGGAVAGALAGRRAGVTGPAARLLVLLPYLAAGAAVALDALPWPALAVALALPAARRTASASARRDAASTGTVLLGHTRLFALLLVAGLTVAAVTGAGLPAV